MQIFPFTRRKFLGGAAALGIASATEPRPAWSAGGTKILRVRHEKDIQNLDPVYNPSVEERNIKRAVLVKLITYKNSDVWEWELDGAEHIEQVDPTHIKFRLRPGIIWTNGYGEVTSEDVKYSYERFLDPKLESPWASEWAQLDKVDVLDKYTGVIVLKQASATIWRLALPYTCGEIVCKQAVEAVGGTFSTEIPATCGPYLIDQWVPQQKTILIRNPDWNGPRPDFDEVHIFPISDEKTAENAFLAGELDITGIALSSLAEWRANPPANTKLVVKAKPGFEWLGMNTEYPPLDDVRVRRAVRMAVDVDTVLEAGYFGQVKRATGLIPKGLPGHREQNPYPPRDVDGAKALLAEAGFPNGFKTKVALINSADIVSMAQVVQANLADVGIDLEINAMEGGMFWTLGLESEGEAWKDVQMVLQRWGNGPDPDMTTRWYTCGQVGKWNWERWCNEEYSHLNAQAQVETDDAKRADIYRRMADILDESAAYVPLNYGSKAIAYSASIKPGLTADGGRFIFPKFEIA